MNKMKQIYKNLYYNEETGTYEFIDENNRQTVKSQEGYLLTYLIEILLKQGKEVPFLSND